jgi:hypothetical protein
LCDHYIYVTHALHISCLLDAPRKFSNDFTQARTVYYTIVAYYSSLIVLYFHYMHHFYDVNVSAMLILLAGLDDRAIGVRSPVEAKRIFPLASVSRPALGPTQPPVQWVLWVLSPGLKRSRGVMLTTLI